MKKQMDERLALRPGEALLRMTDHIPRINNGGCLKFAVALYDALKKAGYRARIVRIGNFTHAVVKVGRFTFDSDGVYANDIRGMLFNTRKLYGRNQCSNDGLYDLAFVNASKARLLAADNGQWNRLFDKRRARSFPKIAGKAVAEMTRETPVPEHVAEMLG